MRSLIPARLLARRRTPGARLSRSRLLLAIASVATILAVVVFAVGVGPEQGRRWLIFSAGLAVIAAVQSVASDQGDLMPALLLSLPPVLALMADGSPTWFIGPLGVLLLVAGELNALSWDCQGPGPMTAAQRRRLLAIGPLAGLGLAASLAVGAVAAGADVVDPIAGVSGAPGLADAAASERGSGYSTLGIVAVAMAALVLALLGRTVFRRGD